MEVIETFPGRPDEASAHLWNSDGSAAEISGNGTRCVAAHLTASNGAPAVLSIETGAGRRKLERVRSSFPEFEFRMTTDPRECRVLEHELTLMALGERVRVVTVDVGNPQCVCRVDSFDFDWRALGAALERHAQFPGGSNVSFVRTLDASEGPAVLDVRFWERGAGATLSSGTGSLGAAVAARHRGWIAGPTTLRTQGGDLTVDWDDGIGLTGPARIIAHGSYELHAFQTGSEA